MQAKALPERTGDFGLESLKKAIRNSIRQPLRIERKQARNAVRADGARVQRRATNQVSPGANSTEGTGRMAFCRACTLRSSTRSTLGST